MVGRLDDATRQSLTRIVLSIAQKDADSLVDELLTLGTAKGAIRRQDLKKDVDRLIQIHVDVPPEQLSMAQMLNDTLAMAAAHGIKVQSDLITLARCIAMSEGLGERLDPNFHLIDFARDFLERHYIESRSPHALFERLRDSYPDLAEVALNLPRRVRRLLGSLERGEVTVTARLEKTDELMESIQRSANRLSMSVLVTGTIVGIAILLHAFNPTTVGIGRWLLQIFMAMVVAGGIGLFIAIWRSGKQP
jgi:ubiquinone biosynthesis protein